MDKTTTLSKREQEVAKLMAEGHTVGAVARHLCRSVKTISTYKARIKQKMSISTDVEWMTFLKSFPTAPQGGQP